VAVLSPAPAQVRGAGVAALYVAETTSDTAPITFVKLLDQSRCIGCHACTTACKSENEVPVGVSRTYVKSVDVGIFPETSRHFQVTRCNQCAHAPCVTACPTSAMYARSDGIVDFDKSACIGCKACIAACPYDAIFINPDDHSAEKCNFCAHRIEMGLEPACVIVCPVEAIIVGNINDPESKAAQMISRGEVEVRRPEKKTRPKVFYRGASRFTLDPVAAVRPPGGIYAWAQQPPADAGRINAGVNPQRGSASQAAAIVSYDVAHTVPWDWRVAMYTWTKSIASGAYVVAVVLVMFGVIEADGALWRWWTPAVAMAFLGLTGALLIWDLEHPARFYYIFTRPQWRSWLVRGGVIVLLFGLVLAIHLIGSIAGVRTPSEIAAVAGLPLAVLTAMYTAFLFAQAKARDLWQSPLLPLHLVVQAVLAGASVMVLLQIANLFDTGACVRWTLFVASATHLATVAGELLAPHGSESARLAVWNLSHGSIGTWFWTSTALIAIGLAAPIVPSVAAIAALSGLAAYEHAYVRAGQSVPLA
jgi:Fe-S-cluster-containing dehydrogenase component/formate-dependent nitrite reductase membrane component NrfD